MPKEPAPTAADHALIDRWLSEIDATDPARIKRLAIAMGRAKPRERAAAKRTRGRPYRSELLDVLILHGIGIALGKKGGTRPSTSIRCAAINLAKKEPFKGWGVSAENIRKRHREILDTLRRGENLHPKMLNIDRKFMDARLGHLRRQAPPK